MSNRTANKANARSRAAEMRAVQARAERRRRLLLAGGAVVAVFAVLAALVVVKLTSGGSADEKSTTAATSGAAARSVVRDMTSVPAATLDKVGAGTAQAAPSPIDAPPLTADGKPKILYVGAEYCPFCAAERWPVVVALSRFGTWTGLGVTTSASNDVHPNTATPSFHGATYTSRYVAFTGVETTDNVLKNGAYTPLDKLSPADAKIFATYDKPPYTPEGSAGAIPFIDIAGEYVVSGAGYSPDVLDGKTHAQIAAALDDASSPIAQAVDGTANVLTATICETTNSQPANVCGSAGVRAAAAAMARVPKQ